MQVLNQSDRDRIDRVNKRYKKMDCPISIKSFQVETINSGNIPLFYIYNTSKKVYEDIETASLDVIIYFMTYFKKIIN